MRLSLTPYAVHGRSYATSHLIERGGGVYGSRRQYAFYNHPAHSVQLAL